MTNEEYANQVLNTVYEVNGQEMSFAGLCAYYGLKYHSVWRRIKRGVSIEKAIEDCRNNPKTWGNTYSNMQGAGGNYFRTFGRTKNE